MDDDRIQAQRREAEAVGEVMKRYNLRPRIDCIRSRDPQSADLIDALADLLEEELNIMLLPQLDDGCRLTSEDVTSIAPVLAHEIVESFQIRARQLRDLEPSQ
jgi:hypothetical protein